MKQTRINGNSRRIIVRRALVGVSCFVLWCLLVIWAGPAVQAAESTGDAAATARHLQLEGARLQLQGKSEEAVKKYRESVALQPNPRLDNLIQQLEGQKKNKEETAAAPSAPPAAPSSEPPAAKAATPAPEQQPVPGQTVVEPIPAAPATASKEALAPALPVTDPAAKAVQPEQKAAVPPPPPPPKRTPGSPEEEQIFALTDKLLSLFPAPGQSSEFTLQTNRDYAIAKVDGEYEVRLQPFTVFVDKADSMELGPVVVRFTPQGKDLLAFRLQFANKIQLMTGDQRKAEVTIGSQQISGLWNGALINIDKLAVKLTDVVVQDTASEGRLSLAALTVDGGRSEDQANGWIERFSGELKQLAFADKSGKFTINSISGQAEANGANTPRFYALRAKLQHAFSRFTEISAVDLKPLLVTELPEYLQLLSGYTGSGSIKGIDVVTEEGVFSLESISMASKLGKDAATGQYFYDSQGQGNAISFVEKGSEKNPQPITVTIGQVGMNGDGMLKPIPATLFADLYTMIEGFQKVKQEEADAYMANHGVQFAKKVLALIKRYKGQVNIKDLKVVNAQPEPVSLDKATFASGFDVGDGQGGNVLTVMDFSGFKGMAAEAGNIPQSGRIQLELTRIPSLLALINDPGALASGDMQAAKGQVMMNSMAALMQSGLSLAMADSFLVFPASKVSLGLLAQADQKAKYMSTGTLNLTIENPEEFNRIVRSFSTDPENEKMMATLTALANRKQEEGKTVDRIDAKIDADGKVFINTKDVTSMFFPPPQPPLPQQPPGAPLPQAKKK